MYQTNDNEIRAYLHKLLYTRYKNKPNTLIIDEFSLEHGRNRADLVVIGSYIHGYEIKSSKDNLDRLPKQLLQYQKNFQKLSLFVAENHLSEVLQLAPAWCNVFSVHKGPRGGIRSICIQKGTINRNINSIAIAHILWRSEAISILNKYGITDNLTNKTRSNLYQQITSILSVHQLIDEVRKCLAQRGDWKAETLQLSYGG